MYETEKIVYTIFGGIITIAAISVIVGRQSKAPQAINAFGSALANIVGAAVSPSNNVSNGNLGNSTFSKPAQ